MSTGTLERPATPEGADAPAAKKMPSRLGENAAYLQAIILEQEAERLADDLARALGVRPGSEDLRDVHRLASQVRGQAARLKRDLEMLTGRVPIHMAAVPGGAPGGRDWARSEAVTLSRRIAVTAGRMAYAANREGHPCDPDLATAARRLGQGADRIGRCLGAGTRPVVASTTMRK